MAVVTSRLAVLSEGKCKSLLGSRECGAASPWHLEGEGGRAGWGKSEGKREGREGRGFCR